MSREEEEGWIPLPIIFHPQPILEAEPLIDVNITNNHLPRPGDYLPRPQPHPSNDRTLLLDILTNLKRMNRNLEVFNLLAKEAEEREKDELPPNL